MTIDSLLNNSNARTKFGEIFFNKYIQYGLTTLSKSDLQDLILSSLSEATGGVLMDDFSDYELANFFKTTDKKISASRMNMLQKQYFEVNRKTQVEKLLKELAKKKTKVSCKDDKIEIQIDNIVQKREFEAYIRDIGHQVDYKNNRQILIITNTAFIETLQKISDLSDEKTGEILANQINKNITNENKKEWLKKIGSKTYELTTQALFTIIPLFFGG